MEKQLKMGAKMTLKWSQKVSLAALGTDFVDFGGLLEEVVFL